MIRPPLGGPPVRNLVLHVSIRVTRRFTWCKNVRDDSGYWSQIETYIRSRTEAEFTHAICPDCKESMKG